MIPIVKLQRLPRPQRLRKIWKIFADAENRLVLSGSLKDDEIKYFCDILRCLTSDKAFSQEALGAIKTALDDLQNENPRRPLNVIRHLLLSETGRSPADWDLLDSGGMLDPSKRRPFSGMFAYLEDIRSPFNVGAMFRTAESFGAEKVFLSPLCADPNHPRAKRSAMGCVEILPWERRDFFQAADSDAEETPFNVPVFALETGGCVLEKFPFPRQGIIIAGSEELGVSPKLLAAADASLGRVSITSYGAKGSLNVSIAFGIVMQAWASHLAGIQ